MINKKGTRVKKDEKAVQPEVTMDMMTCEILEAFMKALTTGILRKMEWKIVKEEDNY